MTTHDEAERGVHILHSLDDLTTLLQIYLPRARLNIVFTAVARIITNLALNFFYIC